MKDLKYRVILGIVDIILFFLVITGYLPEQYILLVALLLGAILWDNKNILPIEIAGYTLLLTAILARMAADLETEYLFMGSVILLLLGSVLSEYQERIFFRERIPPDLLPRMSWVRMAGRLLGRVYVYILLAWILDMIGGFSFAKFDLHRDLALLYGTAFPLAGVVIQQIDSNPKYGFFSASFLSFGFALASFIADALDWNGAPFGKAVLWFIYLGLAFIIVGIIVFPVRFESRKVHLLLFGRLSAPATVFKTEDGELTITRNSLIYVFTIDGRKLLAIKGQGDLTLYSDLNETTKEFSGIALIENNIQRLLTTWIYVKREENEIPEEILNACEELLSSNKSVLLPLIHVVERGPYSVVSMPFITVIDAPSSSYVSVGPIKIKEASSRKEYLNILIKDSLTGKTWRLSVIDNSLRILIPGEVTLDFEKKKKMMVTPHVKMSMVGDAVNISIPHANIKIVGDNVIKITAPNSSLAVVGPVIKLRYKGHVIKIKSEELSRIIKERVIMVVDKIKKMDSSEMIDQIVEEIVRDIFDSIRDKKDGYF